MKAWSNSRFTNLGRVGRGIGVAVRAAKAAKTRNCYLFKEVERIKERATELTSVERYTEAKYLSDLYGLIYEAVLLKKMDQTLKDLVEMNFMTLDPRSNAMAIFIKATADFDRKKVSKFALKLEIAISKRLTPSEFRLTLRECR